MKYLVTEAYSGIRDIKVEASSGAEAIDRVRQGDGEEVHRYEEPVEDYSAELQIEGEKEIIQELTVKLQKIHDSVAGIADLYDLHPWMYTHPKIDLTNIIPEENARIYQYQIETVIKEINGLEVEK